MLVHMHVCAMYLLCSSMHLGALNIFLIKSEELKKQISKTISRRQSGKSKLYKGQNSLFNEDDTVFTNDPLYAQTAF